MHAISTNCGLCEMSSRYALRMYFSGGFCIPRIIYIVAKLILRCPLDDDLLFTETNFTLSIGNRICFDVMIIDDDVIEYMKYNDFSLHLKNGTYHAHFNDYTHIIVTDNEGWFLVVMKLLKCCQYRIVGAQYISH